MSGSESGMAGTDTADPIISGGNGPTIGGRGVAYCMSGAGDDRIWNLGGGNTTYGDAGDDTPYAGPGTDTVYGGPGTDTIKSGESGTVHDGDDSDGDGQ